MILVFGSIVLDLVFPVARPPRLGETVLGEAYAMLPGGKGANQALAAARDGARTVMIGAVGDDAFAGPVLALLRDGGVDLAHLATVSLPTACAAVVVGETGDNQIAVASGANMAVTAAQVPDALLGPGTTLLLQLEVPVAESREVAERARAAGARVILNYAPALPEAFDLLGTVDILIANETEAAFLGGAAEIIRKHRIMVIETLGAEGAEAHLPDGSRFAIPAHTVNVVDTTGAGDTFTGVLAAGLDRGLDLPAAMRRANVAAGLACMTRGAQPGLPLAQAIDAALGQVSP